MSDVYDQATEFEELHRDLALKQQAARARLDGQYKPGDWRRVSAKWCEAGKCGERIPEARRRAVPGVKLCVRCQAMNEKQEMQTR